MADYYVRSGASGTGDGSSWANAYTAIEAGAEAVSGAGNTLYVADGHSESHASAITLSLGGSNSTGPMRVLCVNDTGDPQPPTAVAAGAVIATTGANGITVSGSGLVYGVHFQCADSGSSAILTIGWGDNYSLRLVGCTLEVRGSGSSGKVTSGNSTSENFTATFHDCEFKFAATGQYIDVRGTGGWHEIVGGQITGAAITKLVVPNGTYTSSGRVVGLDASACATNVVLVDGSVTGQTGLWTLIGIVLPAGWTGTLVSTGTTPLPSCRVDMIDSTDGTTRYRRWIATAWGSIRDTIQLGESIYTTDGAYDGVARYSHKFAASSRAENRSGHLVGPEMSGYAETAAAHTATVEICHDGASALTDQDVWLEVFCDGEWVSDRSANPLAAGTAQATSAVEWTGDTGTGPNGSATWHTLKLVCSFTPSAAGFVMGRVVLAKASTTVYVDPILTVAAV